MAAVCPAGPEPITMTLRIAWLMRLLLPRTSGACHSQPRPDDPARALPSDRRGLERRLAVLHVDAEADALASMPRHQCIAVLLERVGELLQRQSLDRLAALPLRANEVVVDARPLGLFLLVSAGLSEELGGDGADHRR